VVNKGITISSASRLEPMEERSTKETFLPSAFQKPDGSYIGRRKDACVVVVLRQGVGETGVVRECSSERFTRPTTPWPLHRCLLWGGWKSIHDACHSRSGWSDRREGGDAL
jgi:hypothetical protein